MEPPSSINAETGKQAGQLSDDPLSCMLSDSMIHSDDCVLSDDTIYFVISSCDDSSCGRNHVYASLPSRQAGWLYLGTVPVMES